MRRRAGVLARLSPKVPEEGPSAVNTLNAALSAAAAFLVFGSEALRFLRVHRDRRKPERAEGES